MSSFSPPPAKREASMNTVPPPCEKIKRISGQRISVPPQTKSAMVRAVSVGNCCIFVGRDHRERGELPCFVSLSFKGSKSALARASQICQDRSTPPPSLIASTLAASIGFR